MADICIEQRLAGALYGLAIGDAMGAPVEGWHPATIRERFGNHALDRFLPPTHGGDPAQGKGDGRVTDDTLMVEALMRAYAQCGGHMDAFDYERFLIPQIAQTPVWVPERQREMPLVERLWWAEKYPYFRLAIYHAEPRSAGIGNLVNCGVAMFMLPVGAVNAGDPQGAYQEAAALALAHNESYSVEAGAVMAAAYASALSGEAGAGGIEPMLSTAVELARDGTKPAIEAVLAAARPGDDLAQFIGRVRQAIAPFDHKAEHTPDEKLGGAVPRWAEKPSRAHAIEELPVALAALKYGAGDFARTLRAGVFYGRDCDSIAGMACGLLGALRGLEGVPASLRRDVDAANRRDFGAAAAEFVPVIASVLASDARRLQARRAALGRPS